MQRFDRLAKTWLERGKTKAWKEDEREMAQKGKSSTSQIGCAWKGTEEFG